MTTKLLTITICFILLAKTAFSQQFDVPANVDLQTKDDYVKYEKDIIAATNWLEATPVGADADKRIAVNAFVMKWITGSPTVSISINADFIVKLTDKNPDLMLMFMAAYTRHALQNNYDTSMLNGYIAGLKSVVALYKIGGKVKKEKFLFEAVKASDDGKLEDWVKTHMNDIKK